MLKFFKEHWVETLAIVIFLAFILLISYAIYDQKRIKMIKDYGTFSIISYDGKEYLINYDIYGGIHEYKFESNETCGENKASH